MWSNWASFWNIRLQNMSNDCYGHVYSEAPSGLDIYLMTLEVNLIVQTITVDISVYVLGSKKVPPVLRMY